MVGHAAACNRQIDSADHVVLYRRRVSLYPECKKVYFKTIHLRCHIAFRIRFCRWYLIYSEWIFQYDKCDVVTCVVSGFNGHLYN